ncbi:hypothetical protein GM418_02440 [Maribellus comscasis]|uniref:Uncharacterized protein n=1 Tax=Maribellus comscasis TaxID=2681766 RepID=A0A6I6JN72_9BACT|nr:DUF6786 family protein [Maribellus comscasis]QGY42549.1 hypothetical protein GM418_02440 [Maribellus comscasis]
MEKSEELNQGTYAYDVAFLKKNSIKTIELSDLESNSKVLLAPGYQGRVITSSSKGNEGLSYGWINYKLFDSGEKSPQFNPIGGEERLWLGPEGGPFSIYFKPGAEQVFANWVVPKELDTESFEVLEQKSDEVSFGKNFSIENVSGTLMNIGLKRSVKVLSKSNIEEVLGISLTPDINFVAFESVNTLSNTGTNSWNSEDGILSLWLLCMFNPSEKGVVFIPYRQGSEAEMGKIVTDDYFGKVPSDRLIAKAGNLFFKVDGKHRSKIGIPPMRAMPYCGSYDPTNKVLTLLWYSKPDVSGKYVNSLWGEQDNPLSGDVINSYNDGPTDDGSVMGPFYEIESSSPAALLKPGEEITHRQRIFHISGDESQLSNITEKLFHLSIDEIKTAF